MQVLKQYLTCILFGAIVILNSCEKFFNPELGIVLDENDYFNDWEEYRSAEMGLYALQQELVEQIIILGELRADLMEVTDRADRDLIEICNFEISSNNKYASPVNFYRLIGACNSLKTKLETEHPSVLDIESDLTRYDRMYGEVLCMRAWAYFNAVRIYGKVPYIYPSLSEINEIEDYVNSSGTYVDSLYIIYDEDGYHNDTIRDTTIILVKTYLEVKAVIDTFTNELENKIKAVGVIHNQNFNDPTWDVTVWNTYAKHALLGQMYLFDQNYDKSLYHFNHIMFNYDSETSNIKYGLDDKFSYSKWDNILTQTDTYEHIFSLWFNKSNQQTNELQLLFSREFPNKYMLKPTKQAVQNWEHMWDGMNVVYNGAQPEETALYEDEFGNPSRGTPGDFYRGYGVSYGYYKDGSLLNSNEVREMLVNKAEGEMRLVKNTMEDVDTVIYKYTFGKTSYDHDANFMVYRAAGIHLYYAEIFVWRVFIDDEGIEKRQVLVSLQVVNEGSYNSDGNQLGVRGRVGFADGDEALYIGDIVYEHDPSTNEVIGYKRFNSLHEKQLYLEEIVLEERARELAYEGERFYDLMRIARRRGDPSFLADKVAAKFSGARKEEIREKLMIEENWYIPLFEN